jgi:LysR family transcriptional regulator, nitrogen assimilation regulatory protein
MELRDLRIFVAIAETGSLAAAAKVLHSSPPSLSARIKDIEDEFGTVLFERSARGLVLTEKGKEFLSHAYAILKLSENAKASMLSGDKPPAGAVRFGVPGSLIELLTVPLIEACLERLPQVRLRVVEGMSGYLASWLREGTLDAALVFGNWETTDLSAYLQPIVEEDLYVGTYDADSLAPYLTDANEIRLRDIRHLRLVMPGPEHGLRLLVETVARRHEVPLNVVMEIDATPQIFKIIRRGHGCTICSRAASKLDSTDGSAGNVRFHAFRVVDPGIKRTVHLATPLNRQSSRATTAVAHVAVETLLSLAATDEWKARRLR